MTDCCPWLTACAHCPECGAFAVDDGDPEDVGIIVQYEPQNDTHFLACPDGHRYWFREKVAT